MMSDFYKIQDEEKLIANPDILPELKARLEQLNELPSGRCVVSDTQKEFLTRIISRMENI